MFTPTLFSQSSPSTSSTHTSTAPFVADSSSMPPPSQSASTRVSVVTSLALFTSIQTSFKVWFNWKKGIKPNWGRLYLWRSPLKKTDCVWHVFVFFQFAKVASWSTFSSATGVPRAALWFTSPNRSTTSGQSNGSECLLNPPQWVLVEYGPFKILYINIFTSNVRKPWH